MSLELNARLSPALIDPPTDRHNPDVPERPMILFPSSGEGAYVKAMQDSIQNKNYQRGSAIFEEACNRGYRSFQIFSARLAAIHDNLLRISVEEFCKNRLKYIEKIESDWAMTQQYKKNDNRNTEIYQNICERLKSKYNEAIGLLSDSGQLEQAYLLHKEAFSMSLAQSNNFFHNRMLRLLERTRKQKQATPEIQSRTAAQAREVYKMARNENQMIERISIIYSEILSDKEAACEIPPLWIKEINYVRAMQNARNNADEDNIDCIFEQAFNEKCYDPLIFEIRLSTIYNAWRRTFPEIFERNRLMYDAELESIWTRAQECKADDDQNKNVYHNILELKRRPHNQV